MSSQCPNCGHELVKKEVDDFMTGQKIAQISCSNPTCGYSGQLPAEDANNIKTKEELYRGQQ